MTALFGLPKQLLTFKQTREWLQVSDSTLHKWVKTGAIKSIQVSTRGDVRFDSDDVQDFIEKRKKKLTDFTKHGFEF